MTRLTTSLMKRALLLLLLVLLAPAGLWAQSVRDSLHAAATKPAVDSLIAKVWPALSQYCATKSAPAYVKQACPIFVRQVLALQRAESLLAAEPWPSPKLIAARWLACSDTARLHTKPGWLPVAAPPDTVIDPRVAWTCSP